MNTNKNTAILKKISSMAALEVVIMTTSNAAHDENFIKMTTFPFQWRQSTLIPLQWNLTVKRNLAKRLINISVNNLDEDASYCKSTSCKIFASMRYFGGYQIHHSCLISSTDIGNEMIWLGSTRILCVALIGKLYTKSILANTGKGNRLLLTETAPHNGT